MKTIYKYVLQEGPIFSFEMGKKVLIEVPGGSKVLTAALQGTDLVVWIAVADTGVGAIRTFVLWGTGNEINSDIGGQETLEYISTVQVSQGLVIHVFEQT